MPNVKLQSNYLPQRFRFTGLMTVTEAFWAFANITLTTMLLLMTEDMLVTLFVGGSALIVACVSGFAIAMKRSPWRRVRATPMALVMVWLPGFISLLLAAAGFMLVISFPDDRLVRLGGTCLFALQILFIATLDATLQAAMAEQSA